MLRLAVLAGVTAYASAWDVARTPPMGFNTVSLLSPPTPRAKAPTRQLASVPVLPPPPASTATRPNAIMIHDGVAVICTSNLFFAACSGISTTAALERPF